VRDVDLSTANPAVNPKLRWLTIEAQEKQGAVSRVQIHVDPHLRKYTATTTQVARFSVGLSPLYESGEVKFSLDGQDLATTPAANATRLTLTKTAGKWAVVPAAGAETKNPSRYGPLRMAFTHRMLFVYGTKGLPDENAWALAKARYDAETFWYRGNGSPEVIPDTAFDPKKDPNRDVILYGCAESNTAWGPLLGTSPVQVKHGLITIGDKRLESTYLACLFVRPRPGSATALVAAVSGTGIGGMRQTNNLPYLQPMIGFPDVLVTDAKALTEGPSGVRVAGFFDLDWGIGSDFVFKE
jgi:hypothetical protein